MIALSLIVAHDLNKGIGINNTLAWHLPEDMAYFKSITCNSPSNKKNVVIMGRKTWESIPEKYRPLPDRINIILSSKPDKNKDHIYFFQSLDDALSACEKWASEDRINDLFCIGGANLYQQCIALENCHKLYITKLHKHYACDAFFPDYDEKFSLIQRSPLQKSKKDSSLEFEFLLYSR